MAKKKAKTSLGRKKPKKIAKKTAKKLAKKPEKKGSSTRDLESLKGGFEAFQVGYSQPPKLDAHDEKLFRDFQSNLLSLISHELRTPMTGILNSLMLLEEEGDLSSLSASELISMARRNAHRLHESMTSLLDLAAIESGKFHVRLREVELRWLVELRVSRFKETFKQPGFEILLERNTDESQEPVLADPQRLGRAVELSIFLASQFVQLGGTVSLEVSEREFWLSFLPEPGTLEAWTHLWDEAEIAFQARLESILPPLSGALQSEEEFLTRTREGLGSELLLIREIVRRHHGTLLRSDDSNSLGFKVVLPKLNSEEQLQAALNSRAFDVADELGAVTLILIRVPSQTDPDTFRSSIQSKLFRSTDSVYLLDENKIALLMDDCRPSDTPKLIGRIETELGAGLEWAAAHCPQDTIDPSELVRRAVDRLKE